MKILKYCSILLICSGCTIISTNRVFPKFAWYWSKDAQIQRDYNKLHNEEVKKYQESQVTNTIVFPDK